jgi:site-specific recombinase XerC
MRVLIRPDWAGDSTKKGTRHTLEKINCKLKTAEQLIAQAKPPLSPPASYQSLRHSFATPLLTLDQDIHTMQDLPVHSNMESNLSHPHALNYGPVA